MAPSVPEAGAVISEGRDEGRDCYKVITAAADWYFDKSGGGFSSIVDRDGNDWIGFHAAPRGVPAGAAGVFRGLPNLVHGQDPAHDGTGHPGFDKCISTAGQNRISARSGDAWRLRYTFLADHVILDVTGMQPGKSYWFLYEGTPGGRYSAADKSPFFWGTDTDGRRTDAPVKGLPGDWQWVYFGHRDVDRVFFVLQQSPPAPAQFYYMDAGIDDDGMVVFGFGRRGIESLIPAPRTFMFGFIEETDHRLIRKSMPVLPGEQAV